MDHPSDRTRDPSSLVIVNTGDGKGKSSAAFGVMGRAWARGWRTTVVQFIKGEKWKTGEQKLAEHLGVEWHTMGDGFTWESTDMEETRAKAVHAWGIAKDLLSSGSYDLLILDELTYVVTFGWVDVDEVVDVLRRRPDRTNVVITGRDAAQGIIDAADTVTDMRKVKHAFDAGIVARKGLEY